MRVVVALRTLALGGVLIGCRDPAAHVTLVPLDLGDCGRPTNANQLSITAYGEGGEVKKAVALDRTIDLADFPDDTVQLSVEVLVGGGATGAAGKTIPIAFADLPEGTAIPILMVPPGGFCPVGTLVEPRRRPLLARAGSGVLVAGGVGPTGPLSTAELYDPETASFIPVDVPEALQDQVNGLSGAVLATLPDGRVVLTGGPRGLLAVFDPATRTFGSTFAISPQRAFHGAVATVAGVLVAGGCQGVDAGGCNTTPLRSSAEYKLDGTTIAAGPSLLTGAVAEGGQLFDVGGSFVLAGGFGTAGEGYRFATGDTDAKLLVGLGAQPVMIDGGLVITAFGADAAPASGVVTSIAPSGNVAGTAAAPALAGARLIALEDGRVVAIGGGTGVDANGIARVVDYDPTADQWMSRAPTASPSPGAPDGRPGDQPGVLDGPSLVRLADGSILVIGGEAAPSLDAWVYRPSLVGATSATVTATPTITSVGVLTASEPAAVDRADGWALSVTDDAVTSRALVGGPRFARGSVKVTANIVAGGLALIAQQTTPGRAVIARLIPGEPARVEVEGQTVCSGPVVDLGANPVTATLEIADGITVRVGDAVALSCNHAVTTSGAWGVAPDGLPGKLSVVTVTVAR